MRRWLVVLGLALMLCLVVLPQTKVRSADQTVRAEDELVRLVREWLNAEARNDRAALDRLVADDFIGTPFGGNILTKADILPPEASGDRGWPKSSLRESTARIFGTTGVVMGRVAVEDPSQPGEFRFTIVYIKRQPGWQMVAAHLDRTAPQQ